MMGLRQLQRELQLHLLDGDARILARVVDAPPFTPSQRLHVYGNAYRVRLTDALRGTYPVLAQVLGDDYFASLAVDFIASHVSRHRSIRWYGRELPQYLLTHAPFHEQPILAEIAHFEWHLAAAFDAADARPLAREVLAALTPDAWGDTAFVFHPSLHRRDYAWNAPAVWQAIQRGETPPDPALATNSVQWLVWRHDLKTRFRSLDAAEASALDAALGGATFADVCEALMECVDEAGVSSCAAQCLSKWVDSGLIVALT